MLEPFQTSTRPATPDRLREQALAARSQPGVYRFIGSRGEVLYVGKSVALRRRLLSYFRPGIEAKRRGTGFGKTEELVRTAAGLEWEYLPNELEALLHEYRLIRAFRPRFNRHHRRLRRYAWIRITPGPMPRLKAARAPSADGSRYFGPFPAPSGLPEMLRELERTIGIDPELMGQRVRSDQLDLLGGGPVDGGPTETVVHDRIARVARFLEGRDDHPLDELRGRISDAVRDLRYELAARLRDREERLRALRDEVVAFRDALARLSCVYLPLPVEGLPPQGYLLSAGRVRLRFDRRSAGEAGAEALRERIRTLAGEAPPPPDALPATEREEAFVVARWFRANPSEWERTLAVERFVEREA